MSTLVQYFGSIFVDPEHNFYHVKSTLSVVIKLRKLTLMYNVCYDSGVKGYRSQWWAGSGPGDAVSHPQQTTSLLWL